MSLLSEIAIEPGKSKTYLRLILVVYVLTLVLIVYLSLYLFIKLILIGVIALLFRFEWINKNACTPIKKIQFIHNEWVLELIDGRKECYAQSKLLITNTLFQLIQFESPKRKRSVVLFHDQATSNQLRLLHLKIAQN